MCYAGDRDRKINNFVKSDKNQGLPVFCKQSLNILLQEIRQQSFILTLSQSKRALNLAIWYVIRVFRGNIDDSLFRAL